ncbi:MAG TPA: DUF1049 domain-containing protein [Gemmatimonadetes bacterium]|jgi:uncharacterized integral membrane protein|nr:DUF1049 domain-containing protein [Gemmatimonadota bacterium]
MIKFLGPLGAFIVLIILGLFVVLNNFQKVRVNLGFVTFERVPITVLTIVGLILGMLLMLLVGIDSDLKVRAILHDRLRAETEEEDVLLDKKKPGIVDTITEETVTEAD